jgi:hypothetical protein
MTRVRRLILLLPLTRPHTGRHQLRARGNADAARPGRRPATALLKPTRTWYLPPPASAGLSFDCGNGLHSPVCDGRNCSCGCHK